jgi:PAS domain S-box-containing protein
LPNQAKRSPSHELRERLRFETLLSDIAARFVSVPADGLDEMIELAQRDICLCLGVEHSSLWQAMPEDPGVLRLTHLFRDPALPPPPIRADARELFPWMLQQLTENRVACVPNTAKAPPEAARDAETWRQYGMKSTLGIPLSTGGGPVFGVISFDAATKPREWPEHLQKRLVVLASVFANALARKQGELKLRESEARVTLAAESAKAGLWTLNPETGEIWATDLTFQLFGLPPGAAFNIDVLFSLMDPRDREPIRQRIQHALSTGESENVEYRVQTPTGGERWLVSRGRRHSPTGDPPYVLMGVTIDITAAKQVEADRASLTRKLLQAQEVECARIARELHDDLGQSIALFSVQLSKAQTVAREISSSFSQSLEELCGKARQIAHRVSTISHQLHSSELELLGLTVAAKQLCREVSELHGVKLDVAIGEVGANQADDTDLCLFRVLQEGLNNAVRHSRARKISVRLRERQGKITLRIADDGVGFDADGSKRKHGLGLVSMAERIRLVGGEFAIQSEPSKGTTIEAAVPISRHKARPSGKAAPPRKRSVRVSG